MNLANLDININEILENTHLISTDSRDLLSKKYFVCFQGENYDAHEYIDELIASESVKYIFIEKDLEANSKKLIRVESCLDFYHELAHEYRKFVNPKLIAITGSAGKTTTKNLLKAVFEKKFKTFATPANYNNEYGVPKTILAMPKDTEYLICEMGMRGLGQIDLLTNTAEPNIAAITNIGTAHIELLGSKENIRKAKLEIMNGFNALNEGNILYLNKELADFVRTKPPYVDMIAEKKIEIKEFSSYDYTAIPRFLISDAVLEDMSLVEEIASSEGIGKSYIKAIMESYEPDSGRGNFIFKEEIGERKNVLFIDETYNSNIEAVKNSVAALKHIFQDDKKIVVLGEIKESDPLQVELLFRDLNNDKDIELVDSRHFEHIEAKVVIYNLLVDNAVVFFKASRSEKLEELIALF